MSRYIATFTQDALAYYYFDFTNDVKTKTLSCLRSIILQLAEQTADTTSLQALQKAYAIGTPPIQEFLEVLKSMICKHHQIYIVLVALDECTDQEELFDLLNIIRDWKMECLSILVTSREEPDIRECVNPTPEQEIRLSNSAIDIDIRSFITETLHKDKKLQVWSEIFPEIEQTLIKGAHGMFRWVDCQLQTLRRCPSRAEVRMALVNLPETLDKTYERILRNIRPNLRDYALRILQWLCISDEPVRIHHIMDAFATSIGEEPHFDPDARFVSLDRVLGLCPGLIIQGYTVLDSFFINNENYVQIAHYSVKEYLVSKCVPAPPDPLCMFRVQERLANLAMAKTCLVYAIHAPREASHLPSRLDDKQLTSFGQGARDMWPKFFRNAGKDSQLMELAISYLIQKNGLTSDGDINAAMDFAIAFGLHDIEAWLFDHCKPSVDPSLALLAKCNLPEISSLDFVNFWIEQGADVNARSVNCRRLFILPPPGSTPLHLAASGYKIPLAQALLDHGAFLEAEDDDGMTPLAAAFRCPSHLTLELIELLWFDGAQGCLDESRQNFLHLVAGIECQQRDQLDILANNQVVMEEGVTWLINHGVNPLSKNAHGNTPMHKAATVNNVIAIKTLYAATGRSLEYKGCLLAFIKRKYIGNTLSTAQLLVEIDPDPFGGVQDDSGFLSILLVYLMKYVVPTDDNDPVFGSGLTALFFKHEENTARTKLDLYISLLEFILKQYSSDVSTVMHWLAMELVKNKDLNFIGIGIWTAALYFWTRLLVDDIKRVLGSRNHNLFRQIRELVEKREKFGVDIKELYRLLLGSALDGGPLAKLIVSQETAYARSGLSDKTQGVPRPCYMSPINNAFVSLVLHSEIHPDTKTEENDAAILNAVVRGALGTGATVQLLMSRLLLQRACDINQRTGEGLTPLAGAVCYMHYWPRKINGSIEILRSCLKAGCDVNMPDDAGRTPLMIAAYREMPRVISLLLDAGCDANLQDREGGISLTEVVPAELDGYGSKQNVWKQRFCPVGGHTALMYAVIIGRFRFVKLLLKYGCDTKLKNNQGLTALDLARQFDQHDIVEILQNYEENE